MRYLSFANIIVITFLVIVSCNKDETIVENCTELIWYQDADKDDLGNPNVTKMSCLQPTGYVDNNNDNDDLNNENLTIPVSGYSTPDTYSGLTLLWADEFNGAELDENNWNFQLGDGCPNICGWGNDELEFYKKENASIQNGNLIIQAKKETGFNNYTSTRVNTKGKFSFKYGRVDVRAALPVGQGIWPAIWMLGENIDQVGWPKCGEIDIMEKIGGNGQENTAYGTAHWDNSGSSANYGGSKTLTSGNFQDEFHVFTIKWTANSIIWYIDDEQFHIIDTTPSGLSEFQEEFHLLINLAVGGNWPGSPDATTLFSQYLIVDYIRVFQ